MTARPRHPAGGGWACGWPLVWMVWLSVLVAAPEGAAAPAASMAAKDGQRLAERLAEALVVPPQTPEGHLALMADVQSLLARKPDLEQTVQGATPLLYGLKLRDGEIVRRLLGAGADASAAVEGEGSAFSLALEWNDADILRRVVTPKSLGALRARGSDAWSLALESLQKSEVSLASLELFDTLVRAGVSGPPLAGAVSDALYDVAVCLGSAQVAGELLEAGRVPPVSVVACLDHLDAGLQARIVGAALRAEPARPGAWIQAVFEHRCVAGQPAKDPAGAMTQLLGQVQHWQALGFAWTRSGGPIGPDLREWPDPALCPLDFTGGADLETEGRLLHRLLVAEPPDLRASALARRLARRPELAGLLLSDSPGARLVDDDFNSLYQRIDVAVWPALLAAGYDFDTSPVGLAGLLRLPKALQLLGARGVDLLRADAGGGGVVPAFLDAVASAADEPHTPEQQTELAVLLATQVELMKAGFDWRRQGLPLLDRGPDAALRTLADQLPPGHAAEREALLAAAGRFRDWAAAFARAEVPVRECRLPEHPEQIATKALQSMEAVRKNSLQAIWLDLDGDSICDAWVWFAEAAGRGEVTMGALEPPASVCQDGAAGGVVLLSSRRHAMLRLSSPLGGDIIRRITNPVDRRSYVLTAAQPPGPCDTGTAPAWHDALDLVSDLTRKQGVEEPAEAAQRAARLAALDTSAFTLDQDPDQTHSRRLDPSWALLDSRKPPRYCAAQRPDGTLDWCATLAGRLPTPPPLAAQPALAPAIGKPAAEEAGPLDEARYRRLLARSPALVQADAHLNQIYRTAIAALAADGRKQLREEQRCWLQTRRYWLIGQDRTTPVYPWQGEQPSRMTVDELARVIEQRASWIGNFADQWLRLPMPHTQAGKPCECACGP